MADNNVDVEVGANIRGVVQGMVGASDAVKRSTDAMTGAFAGLRTAFDKFAGPFVAMVAILQGGKLFRDAITSTLDWTLQIDKLSRSIGVTHEQASVLAMALDDLEIETTVYTKAATMMTRQLASGADGLRMLGIETTDVHGKLRPTTDLMTDAIAALNGLKAGTDRNVAGMKVFGRGWAEVDPLLRLSKERMEDARVAAEELHLIVGPEGVAQARAYKEALDDVQDVFLSLKVQIGNAVLPTLIELGKWLGETGPEAATGISTAIKGVIQAFLVLWGVISTITQVFGALVLTIGDWIETLAKSLNAISRGELQEAVDAFRAGAESIEERWKTAAESTAATWASVGQKSFAIWNPPERKPSTVSEGGNVEPPEVEDKSGKLVQAWKQALEEIKAREENWYTWSSARELAFWQEKLAVTTKGTSAYRAVLGEVNRLRKDAATQEHDDRLAALATEIADGGRTAEERLALMRQVISEEERLHGAASKEAIAARRALARAIHEEAIAAIEMERDDARISAEASLTYQRQVVAEEARIHGEGSKEVLAARQKLAAMEHEIDLNRRASALQLAQARESIELLSIDLEAEAIRRRAAMHEISAQKEIEALAKLEQQKYEIRRAGIDAQLADDRLTTEQRALLILEMEGLELEHGGRMDELRGQQMSRLKEFMAATVDSIAQKWGQGIEAMLNGTLRFSDAMKGIWGTIRSSLAQSVAKMTTDWIMQGGRWLAFSIGAKLKELLFHQAVEKSKAVSTVSTATTEVGAKAATAAAGAASSAAAIPYVGWAIAIGAAIAVLGAVLAFRSNIGSAAGGWDLGPGMNPMAQLHAREMVLPENLADKIRNLPDGGEGQTGPAQVNNWNISAIDSRSFEDTLRDNDSALVRVFRDLVRNGRGPRFS
jgi:hypothetical protein